MQRQHQLHSNGGMRRVYRLPGVVVRVTVRKSAGPGSTPRPGAGKRSGNGGQSKGYGIFPSCPGFRPEQERKDTNLAYPSSNFHWEVATLVAESWEALIGSLSLD